MHQKTIRKPVQCSGIGLHSGRKVELTLSPAAPDTGIVFAVRHGEDWRHIAPGPNNVCDTGLATTLTDGAAKVSTVEHLLAAIRGLGLDNVSIRVSGAEVPIMDGSAASFVFLLRSAGMVEQPAPRRFLRLTRPMALERDGKSVRATPYDGFAVDCAIDFKHPLIGRQDMSLDITPDSFVRRLAKARTFGFLRDVERLQRAGLALGGSLDNAVVLDEYGVVNPEGLRFKDEFVRHKVLDFVGDMAVAPLPILGRFEINCSGHALNNEFLRFLVDNAATCLETVSAPGRAAERQAPAAAGVGEAALAS
ncbi:MAG: UDP-3-O-acyl-N-acetylglucosamine deacetylase [Thermodesulfobacteriota bacterium]